MIGRLVNGLIAQNVSWWLMMYFFPLCSRCIHLCRLFYFARLLLRSKLGCLWPLLWLGLTLQCLYFWRLIATLTVSLRYSVFSTASSLVIVHAGNVGFFSLRQVYNSLPSINHVWLNFVTYFLTIFVSWQVPAVFDLQSVWLVSIFTW